MNHHSSSRSSSSPADSSSPASSEASISIISSSVASGSEAAAAASASAASASAASVAAFAAANDEFRENCYTLVNAAYPWYDPRRYKWLFRAWRYAGYCQEFGWEGYRKTEE